MKTHSRLFVLSVALLSLSCSASDKNATTPETVRQLITNFFSEKVKPAEEKHPLFKIGDFNGDGIDDIATIVTPLSKPGESARIKVTMPWVYPGTPSGNEYHKSLVIFNGSKTGWMSDQTRAFLLLDTSGALETPSFDLLVSKKSDNDYKNHSKGLPTKITSDLIIIPTEAGIDTYVYWDKSGYVLFEPDEAP